MFWADKKLQRLKGPQVVNDSFTPSGNVHMGSLKGPVIHDVLSGILRKRGLKTKFLYGFDDADPIDGLPRELLPSHSKYLGTPLFMAPSPDGNGSFADFFSGKMEKLLKQLGIEPDEIYRTSHLYKSGKFDSSMRFVLDNVEEIRKVYSRIYKKQIAKDWFPVQVICPNCGKLGTTKVTAWDGKEVLFECTQNLVKWAEGCGQKGKISPFGGHAKMIWKVEWAAKWAAFGVTIEGAGKDHASAGGSYDVAMSLVKDVFSKPQPMKLAYEFFLVEGKKMSSSKGLGLTAEELLEIFPPQIVRFFMIKNPPEQAIEFNIADKNTVPRLYDDYQKAAESFFRQKNDDYSRSFELSQIEKPQKPPDVNFSTLAQWVQMPNMEEQIVKHGAEKWAEYARVWVEKYAPEQDKFTVAKELPPKAHELTKEQKQYLLSLSQNLDAQDALVLQERIYDLSKKLSLPSKDAFSAIYTALLGKDHGPKAAWLIQSLDPKFVKERFKQASV